jgi:hypothetical protein
MIEVGTMSGISGTNTRASDEQKQVTTDNAAVTSRLNGVPLRLKMLKGTRHCRGPRLEITVKLRDCRRSSPVTTHDCTWESEPWTEWDIWWTNDYVCRDRRTEMNGFGPPASCRTRELLLCFRKRGNSDRYVRQTIYTVRVLTGCPSRNLRNYGISSR